MKTRKTKSFFMVVLTMACALWASTALALPSYVINGYTNSLFISDAEGIPIGQAYGDFKVMLTGGTAESTTAVSGLTGTLSFIQDPTPPVFGFLPPTSADPAPTTLNGTFLETFALWYDATSGYLNMDNVVQDNQTTPAMFSAFVGPNFDLMALSGPIDISDPVQSIFGTIDGNLADMTLDAANFSAVPEPSTFLLIGAGLAGLAFYRRRQA